MNVFCKVRPDGNQIHRAGDRSGRRGADEVVRRAASISFRFGVSVAAPAVLAISSELLVTAEVLRNSRRFIRGEFKVQGPNSKDQSPKAKIQGPKAKGQSQTKAHHLTHVGGLQEGTRLAPGRAGSKDPVEACSAACFAHEMITSLALRDVCTVCSSLSGV